MNLNKNIAVFFFSVKIFVLWRPGENTQCPEEKLLSATICSGGLLKRKIRLLSALVSRVLGFSRLVFDEQHEETNESARRGVFGS